MALGQAVARPVAATAAASAKAMAFDVVSIRPSKPGSPWGGVQVLPDGYRAWGIGLWATVAHAYFQMELYSTDRLQGMQPWMTSDKYDVEAKVAPADVAEWQRQTRTTQPQVMLQTMLQGMLAERCKLVVHRIPAEIEGYALVVGKNGPKLKETPPGEVFPAGHVQPDGGEAIGYRPGEKLQVSFYGFSMGAFAHHLSGMSFQHPVVDKTGLTGKYDFVLLWQSMDPGEDLKAIVVSPTDSNPLANWNFKALGLEVRPIKIPTETIVIDHIERPSVD